MHFIGSSFVTYLLNTSYDMSKKQQQQNGFTIILSSYRTWMSTFLNPIYISNEHFHNNFSHFTKSIPPRPHSLPPSPSVPNTSIHVIHYLHTYVSPLYSRYFSVICTPFCVTLILSSFLYLNSYQSQVFLIIRRNSLG